MMRPWRDIKLAQKLAGHFGVPAKVENDANAADLAEVLFGAASLFLPAGEETEGGW